MHRLLNSLKVALQSCSIKTNGGMIRLWDLEDHHKSELVMNTRLCDVQGLVDSITDCSNYIDL